MPRFRPLLVGLAALAALALAAASAPAQHPPATGNTKMWPWNIGSGYVGYSEPPRPPSAAPGPTLPAQKYSVRVYTLPKKTTGDEANSAELVAHLPDDADIWFQGMPLGRKDKMMREFISPPLEPGRTYTYDVRVNWAEEGHRAEQAIRVRVQAGDILCLDLRPTQHKDVQAEIRANLEKLSPEDRKLAEAQGFCAVQEVNPLGSMGKPVKLVLKGQSVFLCCPGCKEKAESNPDATLARVKALQAKKPLAAKP